MQQTEKTGKLIALKDVLPEDELMMITKGGVIIRCPVEGIRVSGRNTQGVKLMNLDAGDQIVDVARVQKEEDEAADDEVEAEAPTGRRVSGPAAVTSLDDLREAQAGLAGVAERTPLIPLPSIGRRRRLKAEHLQPIGAFKIRGAWTALRRLPDDARRRGVVTSSSGNHGLGIAFAAQRLGVRAVVVMPESAAGDQGRRRPRVSAPRWCWRAGPAAPSRAPPPNALALEEGLTLIPPFDHPDVIAGQGTCGLEILEQWPAVGPSWSRSAAAGSWPASARRSPRSAPTCGSSPSSRPPCRKLSAAFAAGHPVAVPARHQPGRWVAHRVRRRR